MAWLIGISAYFVFSFLTAVIIGKLFAMMDERPPVQTSQVQIGEGGIECVPLDELYRAL